MKTRTILLSGILMAAAVPAFAQATSGIQGMRTHQNVLSELIALGAGSRTFVYNKPYCEG